MCANAKDYTTAVQSGNVWTLRVLSIDTEALASGDERTSLTPGNEVLTLAGVKSGKEALEVSWDEMSHEVKMYSYTVRHLNADWTEDNLNTTEYLQGFTTADVTDYEHSFNTQQLYTHYRFTFPNEDMCPTLSGNYAIIIYEDGRQESPVATACFSIVEPLTKLKANVRSNTDIELSGRYQQLDIEMETSGVRNISPDEFRLVVEQNGRLDNRVFAPKPTYVSSNQLSWKNCRSLIFEGGVEYQHFDIASVYFMGHNVDKLHFDHTFYHAFLFPSEVRAQRSYLSEPDADGAYVINAERTDYDDTEADYMFVHFLLPAEQPWFDGHIYLLGKAWGNRFTPENRMTYDNEHHCYTASCYLKQGGYEWQYAFVQKGAQQATLQRVEGSHWQTSNTYRISVYHRPVGSRYDQLIGVYEVR